MSNKILQTEHTCPWWFCRVFDNPLRRLIHDPIQILTPYVNSGDTALDLGCGMGYFTLGLAELVGENGQVVAVDLQEKMLAGVRRRVERVGWSSRVKLHLSSPEKIGLIQEVDFVLGFWVVHEVRDQEVFLGEIYDLVNPGGQFLLVEPKIHVTSKAFEATLSKAAETGFRVSLNPEIRLSWTALFNK